jgi:hypothetical protein
MTPTRSMSSGSTLEVKGDQPGFQTKQELITELQRASERTKHGARGADPFVCFGAVPPAWLAASASRPAATVPVGVQGAGAGAAADADHPPWSPYIYRTL